MSKTNEELCEECLTEMFRRVGEEYPNKEFTDQDKWYLQHSWTVEEEDDFRDWMHKKLRKAKFSKHQADMETAMFLLYWGWKTDFGESTDDES